MRWTLPNILTVLRLLAAPGVAIVFVAVARPWADWLAIALFIGAALTDFLDGYLARRLGQISAFGRMLDPIADKAMVVIALSVIVGLFGLEPLIVIPVAAILLREIFISGLREFLGADAGALKATWMAKSKTTVQMVAIPVLLVAAALGYQAIQVYNQIGPEAGEAILEGTGEDRFGFARLFNWSNWTRQVGVWLLWLAAVLTFASGLDYLRKAWPYLRDDAGK